MTELLKKIRDRKTMQNLDSKLILHLISFAT